MKLYKFICKNKYVYTMANNIIEAKKWVQFRYGEAKFITIKKSNIMKVKIKNADGSYSAAEWTIANGVMVVSPKEVKFEPKDGDALSCFFNGEYQGSFIFEEASECGEAIFHVALDSGGKFIKGNGCYYFAYVYNARPATEEEKQKLFDRLAEEGYEWDAERKELVKKKWRPKEGEAFWSPMFFSEPMKFKPTTSLFNKARDRGFLHKGWVFRTEEECQKFCDKLNEVINQIKP